MCLRFLAVSQVLAISAETMRLEAFSVGGRGEGGGRPDEIILAQALQARGLPEIFI